MVTNRQYVTQQFIAAYHQLHALGLVGTRAEYAERCGITNTNLSAIEAGRRTAPIGAICNCISYYKVSPVWLFLGQGEFILDNIADGRSLPIEQK